MGWIESHTHLVRHHKVLRMATALGIKPVQVVGHLHCLWHSVMELREDGDITDWTPDEIAFYSRYEGPSGKYLAALENGWIDKRDGRRLIHDWLHYAWRALQGKYRTSNPKLLDEIRQKHSSDTQKDEHKSDRPVRLKRTKVSRLPKGAFLDVWESYPKKVGRDRAEARFMSSVKNDVDLAAVKKAMKNYLASDRVRRGFIQDGATWFGRWRDWVDYVETTQSAPVQDRGKKTPLDYAVEATCTGRSGEFDADKIRHWIEELPKPQVSVYKTYLKNAHREREEEIDAIFKKGTSR